MKINNLGKVAFGALFLGLAIVTVSCTGCQLTQNGQTLPSPDYLNNNIQYFPAGNEFQYQEEVDWMAQEKANRDLSSQKISMQ